MRFLILRQLVPLGLATLLFKGSTFGRCKGGVFYVNSL